MSFAKRGYMHSTHVSCRSLCVLCVALFLVLTTEVSAQRNQVEITERNVGRFERLLSRADPGTEFVLSTDAELTSTLPITANRITLRGSSPDARPVIQCRTQNEVGFQISSNRVQFVDLIIRGCRGTAVSISSVVETDDPFAQQDVGEPVRLEVEFRNVDFVNNTGTQNAGSAGALFIGRRVEAEIRRCNFIDNSASIGGAIRSLGTSLQITNSVFRNNTGTNSGGAIRGDAAREDRQNDRQERSLSIRNSQFLENQVLVGNLDQQDLTITSGVPLEANQYLKFPLPSPSGGALHLAFFGTVSIVDSQFEGNTAVPAGGAIHLSDNGETEIQNCTFRQNSAQPMTSNSANAQDLQVGGAMFVAFSEQSSQLEIRDSEFVDNRAVYGGAIHIVGPVAANIALFTTVFRRNVASLGGGAIVFRNVDSPEITRCEFVRNSAFVGGAIFVTNGAGFKSLEGIGHALSNFSNNVAYDGGAIFGIGSGTVQIFSTYFQRNQAQRHGGAACFIDSKAGGELGLQDTRMRNNTAEKGGALFLENIDRITFFVGPPDPNAEAVFGEAERSRNELFGNEAVAGGAIFYRASNLVSNSFTFGECDFVDNRVHSNLSTLYDEPLDYPRTSQDLPRGLGNRRLLQQRAEMEDPMVDSLLDPVGIDPCYPGGGGAVCLVLSGISQRVPVSVLVADSLFENNSADVAGGLFLSTDEEVEWMSRCPPINEATSTLLTSDPCRWVRLRNLTFINNSARFAGGGMFASNLTHVLYSSAPDEVSNARFRPLFRVASREEFGPNSVQEGGFGPNIASMATQLQFQEPLINPSTGLLIRNHSSGQSNHLQNISLLVKDRLGQVVTAGIQDSNLRVHVSAILHGNNTSITSGQIDSIAESGIANFSALALSAPAGVYTVEFLPPRESINSTSGLVELRPCLLGEINKTEDFLCNICLFESFTFNTSQGQCSACPEHARCSGGASLVPESKYWHSSPFSTIMHECFHSDACSYENRSIDLERKHLSGRYEFLNRILREPDPEFTNEEYPQCSKGYQGPLCGACEEGYGRTDGKTCAKCGSRSGTAAVVFLLALWQLLLLSVTIRSALVSIRDMNQMMTIIGQNTQTTIGGPSVNTAPTQRQVNISGVVEDPGLAGLAPEQIEEAYAQRQNIAGQSSTMALPVMAKQKMSIDYIIAAQHVSETIKIFVNFFQVTSVAVNINVEWTTTIKNMLATMNSIAGFSNGATFTPMTCMLDDASDHRSIFGVVLRIAFPLFLMLLVLIFFALQWMVMMKTPNYTRAYCCSFLKSRVVILFLVVVFFSYQSISEELMSTVSCIDLDSGETSVEHYDHFSIARDRYWTEDTNIQCFERKHAFLAGFLGIPGIVFFLVGVPVYLLFFLLYKRSQGKLLELNVLNTYGFIYQNYEERFVYWEVCILLRKALIGAIIVFAYPLGANLQGVMALGVLILALAIHLIAAPFKYLLLNVLEGCSLLVSIFTFYAGVVFNDENTSYTADVLLSALLVLINLSLVTVFLVCVFKYGDKYVVAKLKFLGVHDIPANFFPRVVKLARVVAGQAASSLAHTLRQTLRGPPTKGQRSASFGSTPKSPNAFHSVPQQSASSSPRNPAQDAHTDHGGAEINIEMATEELPNGAEEGNL